MADREWREASDMRPSLAGLAVVLAVAAALRFWALGSGIPHGVPADESDLMARVLRMMQTGDFNPHRFDQPTLYVYLQLLVACIRFVAGASAGLWTSVSQVDAGHFYLWGRILTAALGTATVYFVYLIGSRWGARHALLAAGLMAVMPYHVRQSHYVLTDVPMAFFTTLSFLLTLRALEKQTPGAFAWAGASAGLAAGTCYAGGAILLAPLIAAYSAANPTRPRHLLALAAVGAAAGCFVLAAPYTVGDLPGFLNGLAALSAGRGASASGLARWQALAESLNAGFWYSGMLLMIWGLIHAVVRAITGPGKSRFLLLLVFPAASFVLFPAEAAATRWLVPLLPFLALLIAIAIVSGVSLLRRFNFPRAVRTALIAALTVVAILPPAVVAVDFDRAFGRPSTDLVLPVEPGRARPSFQVVRIKAPSTTPPSSTGGPVGG